jgi:phosphoserine aminotransferase
MEASMPERRLSFAPGSSMLPEDVISAFSEAVCSYGSTGLGILELGHRSTEFGALMDDTLDRVRFLAGIPGGYEVLVLHGGARMQFAMLPANLLPPSGCAAYLDSGHFARAAADEARAYGQVVDAGSSAHRGYARLPAISEVPPGSAYLHYTSNNTEIGTQSRCPPPVPSGTWLACDASSDLLTRPFDVEAHGVIYATAHKNLGTAGLALVIIRQSLLPAVRALPSFLRYETHARAGSRYNTPPIASVCMLNLMLRWIAGSGGVAEMARRSRAKAAMLYDAIDGFGFYRGLANPADRSLVNVTFSTPTEQLNRLFIAEAASEGLNGLSGYRKVGGLRASLFNAVSIAHCKRLTAFMAGFAARHRSEACAAGQSRSATGAGQ